MQSRAPIFLLIGVLLYLSLPHFLFFKLFGSREYKPSDIISLLLLCHLLVTRFSHAKINSSFICFASYYLLRGVCSLPELGFSGILFSLKFIQYGVVVIIIDKLTFVQAKNTLSVYIFAIIMYLIFEFLNFDLFFDWGGRYSAQFGGPYELSSICLLVLIFYRNSFPKKIALYSALVLSKTKAAYFTIAFYILFRRKIINIILILPVLVFVVYLFTIFDLRLLEFISGSQLLFDKTFILDLWNSVPISSSSTSYNEIWSTREVQSREWAGTSIDLSTFSRLYTYILALKGFNLFSFLWGNGPGFYGTALDSSILRVLGEVGLIGLLFLIIFISSILRSYRFNKLYVFLFFVLIALSDVLFSARFLVTFFLILKVTPPIDNHRNFAL